jgi:hypothetical protein
VLDVFFKIHSPAFSQAWHKSQNTLYADRNQRTSAIEQSTEVFALTDQDVSSMAHHITPIVHEFYGGETPVSSQVIKVEHAPISTTTVKAEIKPIGPGTEASKEIGAEATPSTTDESQQHRKFVHLTDTLPKIQPIDPMIKSVPLKFEHEYTKDTCSLAEKDDRLDPNIAAGS